MKFLSLVVFIVLILCATAGFSQNTSNKGTEFWTAYMDHIAGAGERGSQMALYITSDVNTSGNVSVANGSFSQDFSVRANQVTVIAIPASAFLGDAEVKVQKGIHITSARPIAVYAHIYAQSVSGATLLLPVNTLGKDYYSINYYQASNSLDPNDVGKPSYSAFMVIGVEDNTTVEITPSVLLLSGKTANAPFTINLKKGEVYQVLSAYDLTGTRIRSISTDGTCKRIAVFSGSSKIAIGCGSTDVTSDNLFQQVYPTAAWGKTYITAPLKSRYYDIFRIIVSDPKTNVKINGDPVSVFTNGFYYEFQSTTPNTITADKPIQVVQYAVSQGKNLKDCEQYDPFDLGDPEMIYLNPLEQTIDHVTLFSTYNYRISVNFINVVIKAADVKTFVLDGTPYTNFKTVPGNPLYAYAQINVPPGTHNISAAEGFNAIAYGFGYAESYGYAAGTNLQDLNKFIVLNDPITDSLKTNGCTGVSYKLQLTLPYKTTSIKWDMKDGSATYTDADPKPVSSYVKDGKMIFVYEYPKIIKRNSGDYTALATVFNPVADECGSGEDIELDYNISDPPEAKFVVTNACLGDSTMFIDSTDVKGNRIKTWLWDFGDGQTSDLQNPKHLYANAGNYIVSLNVTNDNGCTSSFIIPSMHISKKPVAGFSSLLLGCAGQEMTFTDKSAAGEENIVQWLWDFGDSTAVVSRTDKTPFTHVFNKPGNYQVKLTSVLANGCSSEPFITAINILPPPTADFVVPDVCLADAFASFINNSKGNDSTTNNLTYLWNFGDPRAKAQNPNTSTEKDGKHKYTEPRDRTNPYHVTLTVTSVNGCSTTITKEVVVNGDTPIAGFKVENKENLCSSDDVIFDDLSSVNFGTITKLVWYFDYNNNPGDMVIIDKEHMPQDHKFSHNFGAFNSPLTKTYAVRLDAWSGATCVNTFYQNVVIKANPIVILPVLGAVCQSDAPIQITADQQGFTGTGTFTGKGITESGLFDPASAGPGITTVTYHFTAQNGCDFTSTQQITVNPVPEVNLPSELRVLEGGEAKINASSTMEGVTYKWIPSQGLDHDNVLDPVASPVADTKYQLTVTSALGCSTSAEIFVRVLKFPEVPNSFTPNADGINDTWNIKYLSSYPNNRVDVYNRYGEKVYSSIGYASPWDGRYKGADLPTGTYYYIINPLNGRKTISGSVTIIR